MDQTKFMREFLLLLDKDSPRSGLSVSSRTLLDQEAETFGKHIWELVQKEPGIEIDETWLTLALLKTYRKYTSEQERAAAIMALRNKVKPS